MSKPRDILRAKGRARREKNERPEPTRQERRLWTRLAIEQAVGQDNRASGRSGEMGDRSATPAPA